MSIDYPSLITNKSAVKNFENPSLVNNQDYVHKLLIVLSFLVKLFPLDIFV